MYTYIRRSWNHWPVLLWWAFWSDANSEYLPLKKQCKMLSHNIHSYFCQSILDKSEIENFLKMKYTLFIYQYYLKKRLNELEKKSWTQSVLFIYK